MNKMKLFFFGKNVTNNFSNFTILMKNIRRLYAISDSDQPNEHVDYRKSMNLDKSLGDLLNCDLRQATKTFDISAP